MKPINILSRHIISLLLIILITPSCSDMMSQYTGGQQNGPVPSGSISINSGSRLTTSQNVTLTVSYENSTQMCFSNDNSTWSSWEAVSGSKNWTISPGHHIQTVYCRLRDDKNSTFTCSDTIIPIIEEKITASDGAVNNYFGGGNWGFTTSNLVLSSDGKTLITSSLVANESKVYIKKWLNGSWQETILTSPDPNPYYFGNSIDCTPDGNTILIGDIYKTSPSAYLFTWNGVEYEQVETFVSPTPTITNDYAVTVALSDAGDRAVVGSWRHNSRGAIYIYEKTGSAWNSTPVKITAYDEALNDVFGLGVDISGDGNTIVVGSPVKENYEGKLYIYKYDGSNWSLQSSFKSGNTVYNDRMGRHISISYDGTKFIAGTRFWYTGNSDPGSAFIFNWNGTSWDETEITPSSGGYNDDKFGYGVSMSSDGNTVAISSPGPQANGYGKAFIFRYNGTSWQQELVIDGPADLYDYYGCIIAISGDGSTIAVGTPQDNSNTGAVYIY